MAIIQPTHRSRHRYDFSGSAVVAASPRPDSVTAGYSGTPLPQKLGIKEGTRLMLLNCPANFGETLGRLPRGVAITRRPGTETDVIVLFVKQFVKLQSEFGKAGKCLPAAGGMLWVAWPKKASKMETDLNENLIRDHGLAEGLVDTKVCAIDETWSGLRFSRRRSV